MSVPLKTRAASQFRTWPIVLLSVIAIVGICLVPGLLVNRNVDSNEPPIELKRSASRVIESIHLTLNGTEDVQTLYSILEPDVSVYYLMGPQSDHPARKYEYRTNLYMSRWHAAVFPTKRTILDGKIYEVWIVRYGGQGRWYDALRKHSYYYVTVASGLWSAREILHSFDGGPDPQEFTNDSVELPDGRVITFPTGSNEVGAAEATPSF